MALHVWRKPVAPAKIEGVHPSFPSFMHAAKVAMNSLQAPGRFLGAHQRETDSRGIVSNRWKLMKGHRNWLSVGLEESWGVDAAEDC